MILKIYIATIIFALIAFVLMMLACVFEIKGRGYKNKEKKKVKVFATIFALIKVLVLCSIPVYNVFFGLMCLFSKTVMEEIIAGTIENMVKDEEN